MMSGKCYHQNGPHPNIPVWVCEHGQEFAVPEELYATLDALGFEDSSWHNDVCPHFTYVLEKHKELDDPVLWIDVWVDHPAVDQREVPDSPRFNIGLSREGHDEQRFAKTNDVNDAIRAVTEAYNRLVRPS